MPESAALTGASVVDCTLSHRPRRDRVATDTWITLVHAFSGAVGGVLSRTATAPADRVRTLMQAGLGVPLRAPGFSKEHVARKYGPFRPDAGLKGGLTRAVAHIYRDGGWRGFYRGNGTNCLKVAPDAAVQFAVNRAVSRRVAGGDPHSATLPQRMLAGGLAGAASQTLIHPVDVIKTQMTVAENGEYGSLAQCVRRTALDPALGSTVVARFYRGYKASLLGIVPYMATQLGTYTFVCDEYARRHGGAAIRGVPRDPHAACAPFVRRRRSGAGGWGGDRGVLKWRYTVGGPK